MKKIVTVALAAIAIAIASSCSRQPNVAPFGWTGYSPEVDSLMVALEQSWLNFDDDSVKESLVSRLRTISSANPDNTMLSARADYWEGRLLVQRGDVIRGEALWQRALATNDSASHPYETYRLRWTTEEDPLPADINTYRYLRDQANFFEQAGDMMLASDRLMVLGMMLCDLGQAQRALPYLEKADSLISIGGFTHMLLGNRINRSKALAYAGYKSESSRLLRQLVDDEEFRLDPDALDVAYNNLFILCNDTAALFDAYHHALPYPQMQEQLGYYQAAIGSVMLARNRIDSALIYAEMARENYPLLSSRQQRVDVLSWLSNIYRGAGRDAEANCLLNDRLEETEMIVRETNREEVFNLDFNQQLAREESRVQQKLMQSRITLIIVIALALIASLAASFLFYRHRNRARMRDMANQLLVEQSNRRTLAAQLALEQNKSLIATIEGNIDPGDVDTRQKVKSAIRTHDATASADNASFFEAFTRLHPDFVARLHQAYPSLTDADRRLLSLIALELPNRRIASILGIRVESVKQARWRIRSKMQLPSDLTIEDAIAPLLQ